MGNIDRRLSGTLLERLFYFWGRLHFEYNLTPFLQKLDKKDKNYKQKALFH